MSRRKARETAFKVLFQVDQVQAEPKQAFEYLIQESMLGDLEQEFAWSLINAALSNLEDIDAGIALFSTEWALERISAVDRSIMRMAISEMRYLDGTLPVVAIDEAIELAKRYGEENSPAFVNAILDRIRSQQAEVSEEEKNHSED